MKQVIFNVGGALSTYTEFDGKKLIVDLGKSKDFNPVIDFLLPLYEKRKVSKSAYNNKYFIDQLIVSHPHRDHLSAITDFNTHFYPDLLTCPNDNEGMPDGHKISWELIGNKEEDWMKTLRLMLIDRRPPLRTTSDQNEFIYYLHAEDEVESDKELTDESYCNNISIATFLIINNYRVFLPGDLQKCGMQRIIDNNHLLKNKLKGGVDVLIAPHHGLKSSFSTVLFDNMKDNKTYSLNIVSEKTNNPGDNRDVDTRYSSSNYCQGNNNLNGGNGTEKCYQVKTSRGHIFIDYSNKLYPKFEIITDIKELLSKF